jgi:hypothetical protein
MAGVGGNGNGWELAVIDAAVWSLEVVLHIIYSIHFVLLKYSLFLSSSTLSEMEGTHVLFSRGGTETCSP